MSSLLEIMDKKSCGKWYAYEQSAFLFEPDDA